MSASDVFSFRMSGHLLIRDAITKEVIRDEHNAIHPENMSEAIALCLANRPAGNIHEMCFGNGASAVSGTGAISYFPPNVSGAEAQLYNQTYSKVVDDLSPSNVDPENNRIRVEHTRGAVFSDIVVYCKLGFNEPSGQEAFDNGTNAEGDYVFDEIGLKSYDPDNNGKLLTHVIFSPIEKTLNRSYEIIYTIRAVLV
jgi:hypothetical protein